MRYMCAQWGSTEIPLAIKNLVKFLLLAQLEHSLTYHF